jgi:hypothetical protein
MVFYRANLFALKGGSISTHAGGLLIDIMWCTCIEEQCNIDQFTTIDASWVIRTRWQKL